MPSPSCTRCPLSEHRTQVVQRSGAEHPTLLFIGEAPGGTEDTEGQPFVGQAGKLLKSLIDHAGIDLNLCGYMNVVACRPKNNRTPKAEELYACSPWVALEVSRARPQAIIAVGQTSLESLLGVANVDAKWARHPTHPIGENNGRVAGEFMGIPVWAVYHPSAALRSTKYRRLLAAGLGAVAESLGIRQSPPSSDAKVMGSVEILLELIADDPVAVAVDTETTMEWEGVSTLLGIGLAWRGQQGILTPVKSRYTDDLRIIPLLAELFRGKEVPLAIHNSKFDGRILQRYGWDIWESPVLDTLVMAYDLRRNEAAGGLGLKELLPVDTGFHISSLAALGSPESLDRHDLGIYCAQDAAAALRLAEKYAVDLEWQGSEGLRRVWAIDRRVPQVTAHMEDTGFHLDLDALRVVKQVAEEQREESYRALRGLGVANPNSDGQIRALLYTELKLPVVNTTDTGQPSTDGKTLRALADKATGESKAILESLLKYREANKLLTGFIANLPSYIQPSTGRVHTHFNHCFVETGRFSSSSPINFQNIPNRTKLGKAVRRAMAAPPGMVLIKADYEQAEMRVLAAFSRDPALLRAFEEGIDVHVATASAMLGIPPDAVTKEQRSQGKQLNFATVYGQGPRALAQALGVSEDRGKELLATYWEKLPEVTTWIAQVKEEVRRKGYAETWFGRRNYYTKELSDPRRWVQEKAVRESVNMRIQGTAADVMRMFMVEAYDTLVKPGIAEIAAQVHDELVVFTAPANVRDVSQQLMRMGAEAGKELGVNMLVDVKVGSNWADVEGGD